MKSVYSVFKQGSFVAVCKEGSKAKKKLITMKIPHVGDVVREEPEFPRNEAGWIHLCSNVGLVDSVRESNV